MKHSKHYFTNTKLTLYALFLCMIPTGANAQLFGGMIKAQQNIIDIGIPASIVLSQHASYFVTSVYDNNYTPYSIPTGPASTDVINMGDGNPLVDVQGMISTTGVAVTIPVTCTASGVLQAYSSTTTIPDNLTQDGIARDLTLSWTSQAYTAATTAITATLKAVGSTLNAKKLDINDGIGSDFLGVLLGQLVYPYNSVGNTTNFAGRILPGNPDRMFGLADNGGPASMRHNFLYLPVTGADGKIWLNNNLGAAYAKVDDPAFQLTKQATSSDDKLAYGSLFQWGRRPDGHELVDWRTSTLSATTDVKSDGPNHANFIIGSKSWSVTTWSVAVLRNCWGTISAYNDPCPVGWRVPTPGELRFALAACCPLKFGSDFKPTAQLRRQGSTGVVERWPGYLEDGVLWTNQVTDVGGGNVEISMIGYQFPATTLFEQSAENLADGMPVRCIKN